MYFRELELLNLEDIYAMEDGEYKKDLLIKRLLTDEMEKIAKNDKKNKEFIEKVLNNLITESTNITGNNPGF
ncbi:MAG: hypothetical protein MJH09_08850 [Cetobacterium sp.]|uniref:Uncharacterized protein n=1 Tax=Cetobacterium ceti TaxID=180163 RepID=A0A1T4L0R4_9FUSO|nr:hypothetical protein [Cetobacterium ceti]MCJ8342937.1 hypothetical protein [Cetobacterium sp.]SJZ48188.1 hypothetical protein SAMN02745174_00702 [Cetobacterium ceti]